MAKIIMSLMAEMLLLAVVLQPPTAMARAESGGGEKGMSSEFIEKVEIAVMMAAKGVCVRGCAKMKDPANLVPCEDNCAVEAAFNQEITNEERCIKDCDNGTLVQKQILTTEACKKACSTYVIDFVSVVAAAPCLHKCYPEKQTSSTPEASRPKDINCIMQCLELAKTADKKLVDETSAAMKADPNCFGRCNKEGGGDQDRVHSCKDACPLSKLAKAIKQLKPPGKPAPAAA